MRTVYKIHTAFRPWPTETPSRYRMLKAAFIHNCLMECSRNQTVAFIPAPTGFLKVNPADKEIYSWPCTLTFHQSLLGRPAEPPHHGNRAGPGTMRSAVVMVMARGCEGYRHECGVWTGDGAAEGAEDSYVISPLGKGKKGSSSSPHSP